MLFSTLAIIFHVINIIFRFEYFQLSVLCVSIGRSRRQLIDKKTFSASGNFLFAGVRIKLKNLLNSSRRFFKFFPSHSSRGFAARLRGSAAQTQIKPAATQAIVERNGMDSLQGKKQRTPMNDHCGTSRVTFAFN